MDYFILQLLFILITSITFVFNFIDSYFERLDRKYVLNQNQFLDYQYNKQLTYYAHFCFIINLLQISNQQKYEESLTHQTIQYLYPNKFTNIQEETDFLYDLDEEEAIKIKQQTNTLFGIGQNKILLNQQLELNKNRNNFDNPIDFIKSARIDESPISFSAIIEDKFSIVSFYTVNDCITDILYSRLNYKLNQIIKKDKQIKHINSGKSWEEENKTMTPCDIRCVDIIFINNQLVTDEKILNQYNNLRQKIKEYCQQQNNQQVSWQQNYLTISVNSENDPLQKYYLDDNKCEEVDDLYQNIYLIELKQNKCDNIILQNADLDKFYLQLQETCQNADKWFQEQITLFFNEIQ